MYQEAGVTDLNIDFSAITNLFARAEEAGRNTLLEYETYDLLSRSGAETPPRTCLLKKGDRVTDAQLLAIPGEKVVLKIVSPEIIHKTEVDGVRIVPKEVGKIRSAWRRMMYEVPERYAEELERGYEHVPEKYRGLQGEALQSAVARDILGVLMVEFMPPDSEAFGNELIVGIRNTREFGMVISAGLGGTDTELYARRFRKGQAVVAASASEMDGDSFFELFRSTIAYQKLAGLTRGQRRIVTDEQIIECFSSMFSLANYYSALNPQAPYIIKELEINPFAFTDYLMIPLDGMCRFGKPEEVPAKRPVEKIGRLLKPRTIGIVGVSTSRMNFGRVILNNIRKGGFPEENIRIIRPGLEKFEGVKCVESLDALDVQLDLFVIAVGAKKIPELVETILRTDCAHTVMLIAGGMGETSESEARADELMKRIRETHSREDGGPIFIGANCLGVVSHPGRYDTMFIPEEKLPKTRGEHSRNTAFISQSGAFMITRLSRRPEFDPAYMVSIGNQNDLTLGDFLTYFKDEEGIEVIGVYAEGFKDLDGLDFVRALRGAVMAGREVIFYKAGRTPEGKSATSGHTASVAGDYMVCESCVRQAGGIVAETFGQFENLMMLARQLHRKKLNGNRLATVSGGGFEAVGMADSIVSDDYAMHLAEFSPESSTRLTELLKEKGLENLVTVKNPFDINPGSDDEAHARVAEILGQDSGVDMVVLGLDPLSPAVHSLDIDDPKSIVQLLPQVAERLEKPLVAVVDGGRLYTPMVDALKAAGMAVFSDADEALHSVGIYVQGRLHAEKLRSMR